MITFSKKAENILNNFKNKKDKEIYIKKLKKNTPEKYLFDTYNYSKKYDIKIIYQKIDFIRLKLNTLKNLNLNEIETTLNNPYTFQDIIENKTDFTKGLQNITLFNTFYILFSGLTYGNQKKLYDIYDIDKNKIGQIVLKVDTRKKNKNVIDSLELSGLFFKCYESYFNDFLEYFKISRIEQNIIKRIDYCIDIKGVEVPELLEGIKDIHKKTKNINGLTHSDKKKLAEITSDLKFGKTETFVNFFNTQNDLKIYDKILDIVDNYMHRRVQGKNPYQDYLDSDLPITRIEVKKKGESFAHMIDNSLDSILKNIESMFFDYLKRYFYIDLSLYIGQDISLNGKKMFLAKEEKQKKILHSYIMAQAYLKNIEDYCSKKELYKFLFKLYPEIEDIKPLELLDEFDSYELIENIFNS